MTREKPNFEGVEVSKGRWSRRLSSEDEDVVKINTGGTVNIDVSDADRILIDVGDDEVQILKQ